MRPFSGKAALFIAMLILLVFSTFRLGAAEPQGGIVVGGEATINSGIPGTTTINQITDRAIIEWQRFGIDVNELVRFIQPSQLAVMLNRVTGVDPSVILGSLQANGRIFLVNPNGVVFGSSARVDVAGLMVSTLNISNEDFMNGRYRLTQEEGRTLSSIVNNGTIKAADGGFVVLIAPLVNNNGTIIANLGKVSLGGASEAILNFDGQGYVNFVIPNGGEAPRNVVMGREACNDALRQIMGSGITQGGSVLDQDGKVVLVNGSGTVVNQGTISTNGLAGADAGSIVLNSTQATVVTSGSILEANGVGLDSSGGDIRVLSEKNAYFADNAFLFAKGGDTGNGGFAEVSGKDNLWFFGTVNALAPNGATGTLLLDPKNITVDDSGSVTPINQLFTDTPAADVTIDVDTINGAGANVILQANNDFTLANMDLSGKDLNIAGAGITLTIQAGRSVTLNDNITTNNGAIAITANETLANGVIDANRDPGAALISLADGKTINAGNQNITITLSTGAGLTNSTSGSVTLENITTTGHVLVANNGPTAGSSIARQSADALVTASSAAFDVNGLGGGGAIGTAADPIRVTVTNLAARSQNSGAYFNSPAQGVTIGGATLGPPTGISTSGGGNINVTANGTLNVSDAVTNGATAATITLKSADIGVTANITAGTGALNFYTYAGTTNMGISGAAAGYQLSQTEINLIQSAGTIRIGESGTQSGWVRVETMTSPAGATGAAIELNSDSGAGAVFLDNATSGIALATGGAGNVVVRAGTGNITGENLGAFNSISTTGTITLNGTGALSVTDILTTGGALTIQNNGLLTIAGATGLRSNGQDITLKSTDLAITTAGNVNAGAGALNLYTYNGTETMDIGFDTGGGAYKVNDAELALIAGASTIRFGQSGTQSGAITLQSVTSPVAAAAIEVNSNSGAGGVIIDNTGGIGLATGGAGNVTVRAGSGNIAGQNLGAFNSISTAGTITLNGTGALTVTDILTTGGALTVQNNGLLTIAGGTGLASNGQNITLKSTDLALTGNVNAGAGALNLYTYNGTETMDIGFTGAGAYQISDAELAQITGAATIRFGESLTQSGAITVRTADFSALPTAAANIEVNSNSGAGSVSLDDDGAGTALASGSGNITVRGGTAGILATQLTGVQAEISTSGTVTLTSAGAVGSGTNRIQFLAAQDDVNVTQAPGGVYFNGLGVLTLNAIATNGGLVNVNGAGTIVVGGAVNTTGLAGAGVTIDGTTTTLANNITTDAGTIQLNDAVTLGANVTLSAGSGLITLGNTTLSDGVLLTLGTGGSGGVTVASIAGTGGGAASDVTFNVTGAVGVTGTTGTDIGTLTVTNSGGTTFTGAVGGAADRIGTVALTNTTGTVQFSDNLYATNLTAAANGYNVSFLGAVTDVTAAVNLQNTGSATFGNGGGDALTFTGGVTHTAGTNAINGNITATNNVINLNNTTTVAGNSTLAAGSGLITLGNTTLSDGVLLTLGTGGSGGVTVASIAGTGGGAASDVTFNVTGAVGVTGTTGTDIGTLTVTNSNGTTFGGTVDAATVTLSDTAAGSTIAFNGALNATTLNVAGTANAYNVAINQGGTITNAATFANTGTLTLGNEATDNLAFTAGVTATAPASKSIAGTISAAGTGIINLGTTGVTVTANTTVGGASTGQITLGATTLNDGVTLNLGTGAAAAPVTVASITGTALGAASNVTFNTTAAAGVTGNVGTDIGTLTITNSNGTTFGGTVDAATVTLSDTAAGSTIAFNGALTATTLNVAGTANAYNVAVNQGGTIANAVTFGNTGALTLGNEATDNLTFTAGVTATAPSGITVNGTVNTTNTNMTLGDADTGITLGGTTTLSTGAGAGNITIGGTVNGAQALTLNAGTGNATLSATAGGVTPLASLAVTGNTLTIPTVNTTGNQTYNSGAALSLNNVTSTAGGISGTTTAGDVQAGTITAAGTVGLDAAAAITNNSSFITANTADLTARNGSIGAEGNRIHLSVNNLNAHATGGGIYITEDNGITITNNSAVATGDIKLTASNGNIWVGTVNAGGAVDLQALLGSILKNPGSGTNVTAGASSYLKAGTGAIGEKYSPIDVNINGTLQIYAGGNIDGFSAMITGTIVPPLNIQYAQSVVIFNNSIVSDQGKLFENNPFLTNTAGVFSSAMLQSLDEEFDKVVTPVNEPLKAKKRQKKD
jgi:filamentous hemagglutinin family protein